jgi:sigma-B regulation protein RsbQ
MFSVPVAPQQLSPIGIAAYALEHCFSPQLVEDMDTSVAARNNVTVSGVERQPILFAHGFGCDQNMWRFVAPAFNDRFKVVLFDYVGCGRSDISAYQLDRYATLEGYARDIVEIAEELDLKDIIFVGHSVSSMIGVLAAKMAPHRFSQLILIVPSACYLDIAPDYRGGFSRADLEGLLDLMEKNYVGWASFLAPMIMKNDDQPALQKELATSFCAADPAIARRFAAVTFLSDHRNDLQGISLPTLIIQCSDDAIAPATAISFVHQQISGSVLRTLDANGHCPHMTHPRETIAVIEEYLAGSRGSPPGSGVAQ